MIESRAGVRSAAEPKGTPLTGTLLSWGKVSPMPESASHVLGLCVHSLHTGFLAITGLITGVAAVGGVGPAGRRFRP